MRCNICGSHDHESNSAGCPKATFATTYRPFTVVSQGDENRRLIRLEMLREVYNVMLSKTSPVLYFEDLDKLMAKVSRE